MQTADKTTPAHDITLLALDHPGANDPAYRRRRDEIAAVARAWRPGTPLPRIAYLPEETETWRAVVTRLAPRHDARASATYLRAKRALGIGADRVPQLADLDRTLRARHGFGLAPVEGLIDARSFLTSLADGTMRCTQYVRHASKPEYTPEPDVIHELVGHAPTFADEELVRFTMLVGRAARTASPEMLAAIERIYWFTVEFGLLEEQGEAKAIGAGLLSSVGELEHCLSPEVERRPFSVRAVVETPYVFSSMQPVLYVARSFGAIEAEVRDFLGAVAGSGSAAKR
jgi:phenylalanine-4-hydroxylase